MDNRDKQIKLITRAGHTAHNTKNVMKDKVLIIGAQGVGKTRLAIELASKLGYVLVDEVGSIEEVKKKATPNTIYVSNAIHGLEARLNLRDFTIIELSNI